MSEYHTIRARFDREMLAGLFPEARESLRALWALQPYASTAGVVLNHRILFDGPPAPRQVRVAILRSFTVEPLVPLLQASALFHHLDLSVHTGDFNGYAQELIEPPTELLHFQPAVVILAIRTPDLLPAIWNQFTSLAPEDVSEMVQNALEQLRTWLLAFRRRCAAHLVLHALELPTTPAYGLLDSTIPSSQTEAISSFNRRLRSLAATMPNVSILDFDNLVARHGRAAWTDLVRWSAIRLPIASHCLHHLATEWLRHIYALCGITRKVVVVDLDNTLWGGLAGEEGLDGVRLGPGHEGVGYLEMQRVLVDLSRRGFLLAVCSKNNEPDALRILQQHPAMLLCPSDFAAIRINWRDKAVNLREIAAELNLGLEAFVFVDDNPVERQRVRAELPEVEVIDLPTHPIHYAQTLRDSIVLDRLSLTDEDRMRGRRYHEQRKRVELAQAAGSLEEFYRSLRQIVTIEPLKPETLARASQLTQKTNQFNLTTRRYTESELAVMLTSPGWSIRTVRVQDRFGDNGIVGLVAARREDRVCVIDTFILSCRVIGRTVESAVLAHLATECAGAGLGEIRGQFLPTAKNAPAATLYPDHGFRPLDNDAGGSWWTLDLTAPPIQTPAWIELRTEIQPTFPVYANR